MPQSNEDRLEALRTQVQGIESEFNRKTNILLDEIVVLKDEMSSLTRQVSQLTSGVNQLARTVDQLTETVDQLTGDVGLITDLMSQMVSHAQEDRARIREIQEDNQRIWQYLLSQSGNGHNSP